MHGIPGGQSPPGPGPDASMDALELVHVQNAGSSLTAHSCVPPAAQAAPLGVLEASANSSAGVEASLETRSHSEKTLPAFSPRPSAHNPDVCALTLGTSVVSLGLWGDLQLSGPGDVSSASWSFPRTQESGARTS